MEIIVPAESFLAATGAAQAYINPLWTAKFVQKDEIYRWEYGGIMRDFRARYSTNSTNPPSPRWEWVDLGSAAVSSGYTYTTNAALSLNPVWATGVGISLGQAVYDQADRNDYEAAIAITSGNNTIRPSASKLATDETISSRWTLIGAANAFAPFDYRVNSPMLGYSSAGTLLSTVTFSADITTTDAVDRIAFAGLANVSSVEVKVYIGGDLSQTVTKSAAYAGISYGMTKSTLIIPISEVAAGSVMRVDVTLTRNLATKPAQVGVFVPGKSYYLAGTEWGVSTPLLDFSRKERNEVTGTTKFIKRGFAKLINATCFVDPKIVLGDVVFSILAKYSGMPIFWDFNGNGSDYDRLQVFGFLSRVVPAITAYTFESLSLDIEGLVE